jgi:hypothetical protein
MSTYAVFERNTNRNLGEGKTAQEAYDKACDTLATAGVTNDRVYARMVEYVRGDQESHEVVLYPQCEDAHPMGQSG